MDKKALIFLIVTAFILVFIGIWLSFIDLSSLNIKIENDGYVSAIFSLAGILLFFTALMYQIKEFKIQVAELEKSVKAQSKSSEALEEQKKLLLEQNANSLIFGMIQSFNSFKERNGMQKMTSDLIDFYIPLFALRWNNNLTGLKLNKEELNQRYAQDIKSIFSTTLLKHPLYYDLKKFVQFFYNIMYIIDQNKVNFPKDIYSPFLFNHLNSNEVILIYLSNLIDSGMPLYGNLHWSIHTTKELMDMIKKYEKIKIDFDDLDYLELTNTFVQIKQSI